MKIGTKTLNLLERKLTKAAHVLDSRAWESGTFYEIDLHVPDAIFDEKGVQYMKCRVSALTYRDYTISKWDATTKTCTLFIDAGHEGQGSNWAKSLQRGDMLYYLHIETRKYTINADNRYLFLGDQSAIGHFLALQQIAGKDTIIDGAIVVNNAVHRKALPYYYPELHMKPVGVDSTSTYSLINWLHDCKINDEHIIHLVGNSNMVSDVRKHLQANNHAVAQIHAQGFWR